MRMNCYEENLGGGDGGGALPALLTPLLLTPSLIISDTKLGSSLTITTTIIITSSVVINDTKLRKEKIEPRICGERRENVDLCISIFTFNFGRDPILTNIQMRGIF